MANLPEITQIEIDGQVYQVVDSQARESIENLTHTISTIPIQHGTLIYNGHAQSPSWDCFNEAQLTLSLTAQTSAGSYTASFTPKSGYKWFDGTTAAKTVTWVITSAKGTLTLDKSTMTLDISNLTGTITPNRHGSDGVISAFSSNTDIATVSVDSSTGVITVTGKSKGSVEISVTMTQGVNYNAVTTPVKCSVTTNLPIPSGNLIEVDWSSLSFIGETGIGAAYFSVGDYKPITLEGTVGTKALDTTLCVFIIGFNHNGVNGIYFQGFKNIKGKQVALCDWTDSNSYGSYKTDGTMLFNMNHWGGYNYGGWKGCDLRYDILGSTDKAPSGYGSQVTTSREGYDATSAAITSPKSGTLMAALPASLRSAMKPMTVYTDNMGNKSNVSDNVTISVDYLPLLSEFEVRGARSYANQYEQNNQKQFDYYKNGNSKIFYNYNDGTTTVCWWCRSPHYNTACYFCNVYGNGGAYTNNARNAHGLAPAFRVA